MTQMAATKPKFRSSTRIMFLLNTAFLITLSVAVSVGEARRCYWCGPLAEQVHRSRRAPRCGVAGREIVTACEPALPHCAVVATAPPYIESRYCVKLYQDECYPLFCNSTKTWKMTCPCRGDLCNGPNTDREIEAFAILAKLVAKTHDSRIIKRAASFSHFAKSPIISEDSDAINEDEPSPINHLGSNEHIKHENISNMLVESYTSQTREDESQVNITNHYDNLTMNENNMESNNILTINETTEALKEITGNSRRTDGNESHFDLQSNIDIGDDSKTLISENLVSNTGLINYHTEVITPTDAYKITEHNEEFKFTHGPSEAAIETKMDDKAPATEPDKAPATESLEILMDNNIKSSEVLPTAEPFQQNDSPTEKPEETKITTASYTDMISQNDLAELTTKPAKTHKSQKNNASKVVNHINLNCIILYIIYTLN